MADLTAADPVAIALGWLRGHPNVSADHGGPLYVSGLYEAPWPRLRVSTGPGGAVDSVLWQNDGEVTLEVVDHPANPIGQAELWRLSMRTLIAFWNITERDVSPADPVVTNIRASGTWAWQPLQTGQGRYIMGVNLSVHPSPF